jgi:uncharacterized protein DUF5052
MRKLLAGVGTLVVVAVLAVSFGITACSGSAANNALANAMRALGRTPGTIYNYGTDGQLVYQAHCASLDFGRDTEFDVYSWDSASGTSKRIADSSVVQISCGQNIIKTVGFTTVYISDSAQGALFANSQQFYKIRVDNNDRGVPLVNFAWRAVKNQFAGTDQVVQVCDQWNNPILAFAGSINGFATDVAKSTMFQVNYNKTTGYVWIGRGSYTVTDTKLLNQSA